MPPGPRGSWLFGATNFLRDQPLDLLTNWARQYGDVVSWRTFHIRIYLLNLPDDIETVLVSRSRSFGKGRLLQANRALFGNGLLTSEGEFWLRQRRLTQPAFHRERVAACGGTMVARATEMLSRWRDGEVRDIHRDMMRVTLAIAAESLFGASVEQEADRVGAALNILMEMNASSRRLFSLLRRLPTAANHRLSRAIGELDGIIYGIIAQRRAAGANGNGIGDDLLSILLNAQDEDGSRMTDRQLRDESLTLLLASHETTAVALSWTAYLLAQHPAVEELLHAELDAVLGGRPPTVEDLHRLRYTEQIVRESLRLYPPVWRMGRIAKEDVEIHGYRIAKGASVLVSQWVVQRDARYFTDPERFDPGRWTEDLARSLPRFAYFPFGGGPRMCIGSNFALQEMALVLAVIAQHFRLRLAGHEPILPAPSITLRPRGGMRLIVSRRS
jgi:cytochrome P450